MLKEKGMSEPEYDWTGISGNPNSSYTHYHADIEKTTKIFPCKMVKNVDIEVRDTSNYKYLSNILDEIIEGLEYKFPEKRNVETARFFGIEYEKEEKNGEGYNPCYCCGKEIWGYFGEICKECESAMSPNSFSDNSLTWNRLIKNDEQVNLFPKGI